MRPHLFRRILAISIPILVTTGFITGILIWLFDQPPSWESSLEAYLTTVKSEMDIDVNVLKVVEANQPWEFAPSMSYIAYGDSVHYQTTWYQQVPNPSILTVFNPTDLEPDPVSDGRQPLPFPPDAAWCVQLKSQRTTFQENSGWTVVIARHSDMYNADFAVHEISSHYNQSAVQPILTKIGCAISQ